MESGSVRGKYHGPTGDSRWRLERRGRCDSIGAAARSYAVTKRRTVSCRDFLSRPLSNIQSTKISVRAPRSGNAATLPRHQVGSRHAGCADAPLQLLSGTESSMLMNAAFSRVYASLSDACAVAVRTAHSVSHALSSSRSWPSTRALNTHIFSLLLARAAIPEASAASRLTRPYSGGPLGAVPALLDPTPPGP